MGNVFGFENTVPNISSSSFAYPQGPSSLSSSSLSEPEPLFFPYPKLAVYGEFRAASKEFIFRLCGPFSLRNSVDRFLFSTAPIDCFAYDAKDKKYPIFNVPVSTFMKVRM